MAAVAAGTLEIFEYIWYSLQIDIYKAFTNRSICQHEILKSAFISLWPPICLSNKIWGLCRKYQFYECTTKKRVRIDFFSNYMLICLRCTMCIYSEANVVQRPNSKQLFKNLFENVLLNLSINAFVALSHLILVEGKWKKNTYKNKNPTTTISLTCLVWK